MCECGCTSGNQSFLLPGPEGTVYSVTFQPACSECDGPDAVLIKKWPSRKALEDIECDELPELPMIKSHYSWEEATIVTGKTKGEFVKDLKHFLVGIDPMDLADEESHTWDEVSAETILEEMYDESTTTPHLPTERP